MCSDVFLENVDNHMYIIHEYPFCILSPFDVPGLVFQGFADQFLNGVYNRIHMGIRRSIAHYEVVANSIIDLSEIKYADVLFFLGIPANL